MDLQISEDNARKEDVPKIRIGPQKEEDLRNEDNPKREDDSKMKMAQQMRTANNITKRPYLKLNEDLEN